jgi:hypothetical protein
VIDHADEIGAGEFRRRPFGIEVVAVRIMKCLPSVDFVRIPSTGMHGLPSCGLEMGLLECMQGGGAAKHLEEETPKETSKEAS